jgi:hypothetical protein
VELPEELAPIDVRRAVLAVLFRANGGPLSIDEIVRLTAEESGLDLGTVRGVSPHRRVSDILRHQVRAGRAEVVGRGRHRLLVRRFGRSTEWRARHWQQARAERMRRRYLGMP